MTTSQHLLNQLAVSSLVEINPNYENDILKSSVLAIESKASNYALLDLNDISVESFFTVLKNRFFLGSAGSYSAGLTISRKDMINLDKDINYSEVRTKPIVVPPGFVGNMHDYVLLLGDIVRSTFPKLSDNIVTARALIASLINNDEQWKSVSKLDNIPAPIIDEAVRDKIKSFFKTNLINEQLFGKVYRNSNEYAKAVNEIYQIEQDLKSFDFYELQKLSNSLDKYMKDINSALSGNIGAKPLAQLIAYIRSVALAVELTAVIPNSMREVVSSVNVTSEKIL